MCSLDLHSLKFDLLKVKVNSEFQSIKSRCWFQPTNELKQQQRSFLFPSLDFKSYNWMNTAKELDLWHEKTRNYHTIHVLWFSFFKLGTIVMSVWYFPLGLSSRNKIYTQSFWCTQFGTISIQCHLWGIKDKMLVEHFRWINPSWWEHQPRKRYQNGDEGTGPEDELCDLLLTCVGWVGMRQKHMWKMSWLAAGNPLDTTSEHKEIRTRAIYRKQDEFHTEHLLLEGLTSYPTGDRLNSLTACPDLRG